MPLKVHNKYKYTLKEQKYCYGNIKNKNRNYPVKKVCNIQNEII